MAGPAAGFALALGAGGARGLSQIVALEAIDELGVKPARIAGCSIGAILGGAYAAGLSGRELRAHVLALFADRARAVERLMQARIGRLADLVRGFGNPVLIDGERLLDLFWPPAVPDRFDQLAIPFRAVATDYHRQDAVAIEAGPLTPAVAASLAIPGLVRPVALAGRVLIDGGAADPLPYRGLAEPGEIVLAIDTGLPVGEPDTSLPGPLETMLGASTILMRRIVAGMVAAEPPDILIRGGEPRMGGLDFFKAKAILEAAEPLREEVKRRLDAALAGQ